LNNAAALPGGRSGRLSSPAVSRIWLAVAAALLMHAALISNTRPSARASAVNAAVAVRVMTVRAIPSAAPAKVALQVPAQESGATVTPALEAASQGEPIVSLAKAAEARPSAASAATMAAPASSAPARTLATAPTPTPTALASNAEATAERVVALPAAPDYLLGATLDPGPQPIGDIEPEYPSSANLQEGKVVIRVLISDTGRVDNVAVVRSAPPGLFEAATLEAFGKARFTPARAAGIPVKSQITVEVHFLPINRGSRISGRSY